MINLNFWGIYGKSVLSQVLLWVWCLVISNSHIFGLESMQLSAPSGSWHCTISSALTLYTDFYSIFFSTNFLRFSFSLSVAFILSLPGVSESWAETGGPWQEVGWLVLQVTLHSCGFLRVKYSLLWYGKSVGTMVVVAFLKALKSANVQLVLLNFIHSSFFIVTFPASRPLLMNAFASWVLKVQCKICWS